MTRRHATDMHAVVDYDPFSGGVLERVVPTTEPQRELWLASKLGDDASLAFNESVSLHLGGMLDVEALRAALQALSDRHDILRANFGPDGETLCVGTGRRLDVELRDLSRLDEAARDAEVQACLRQSVETPFELGDGALFRATLLRLAADRHRLVLSAHHIVCDGWSWWVIVRELGMLYARALDPTGPALPEVQSFAGYALDQALHPQSPTYADDEAFWLSRFSQPPPVLELPLDRPRPPRRSFASRRYDHEFDADLVAAVRRLGARQGASLFATLLAGFGALVSRLSGQDDVVVGIPAAGQSVDGHDRLVGHCVNLLPLRFDMTPERVSGAATFEQMLASAQDTLLDALDHQRYTFGTLLQKLRIERDPARLPLVSVMFNIDQALDQESNGFPGLSLEFDCNPRCSESFELSINAVQVHGRMRLECQYNRDLFDEVTVRRWMSAYEALLRAAVAQPQTALASLPLVDEAEAAGLTALQPSPVTFDRDCLMHEAFERQCDRTPDRIAVRHGGAALTYSQLDARANRIARLLRSHGVHRGSLVGLALPRGIDMLAALLGVLKAGAGYVPLDPGFPPDRLSYMASDAGLAALLTESCLADGFDLRGRPVLAMDRLAAELDSFPEERIGDDNVATPESVAYVIYTSGSTGRPKGVRVPHRAVTNFIVAMQREPGIGAQDRLLAVTTLSFDIAVLELMLPLSTGAEVLIASRDDVLDGHALKELIESHEVTYMQATPATWRLLVEAGWEGTPDFKILCGGEAMPVDLAMLLLERCGSLWNMYGPTETTVWSTCARIEPAPAGGRPDIHIGRPVANTRIWILDERGQPCPRGVPGEICIGGDGVALGYLDRPELTTEQFVPESRVPFANAPRGAMMYRTGDRGRWRPDGNLEHLGRLDFQVKVRGYRIELGEIESVLARHASVARAVVVTREDRPGDVRLVAYVVPVDGSMPDEGILAGHLRASLPEYMLPQHYVAIDAVPLLPNGKIDRKGLPAPETRMAGPREAIAPRNPTERAIAVAMAETLGLPSIGIEDDFFANGGHSLIAAQLISRVNRELGATLTLRTLFDAPTVVRLAAQLGAGASKAQAPVRPPIVRRVDQHAAPLSPMQQRLWVLEHMQPGRVTWNTPSAHRLRGPFDHDAFQRAFQAMVCRQASLRTVIVEAEDGPVQHVRDDIDASLPYEDLGGLEEAVRLPALMDRMEALIATPFQLDEGPLFVARLYRMGEDDHVLFFMTHHIIWDGWSFDVFYKEMSALYEAFSAGHASPLPALRVSYGDFAEWQLQWLQGGELSRQLDFWKAHLAGSIEPLQLPHDRPRPPEASGAGSIEWISVGRADVDAMRALAKRADATLFMALLATYYVLLHRLGGQRDLVVGLPVRNRDDEDIEAIMGFFVNMLPTRLKIDPSESFLDVLVRVRAAVLDAFSHPDVPFDLLVRELDVPRDPSRAPLYQATFSFQDVRARDTRWGQLEHEHLLVFQKASAGDVGLWFLEHGEGLSGVLSYNTDIFTAATARLFNQRYSALLASALERPEAEIGALSVIGAAERSVRDDFNSTRMPLPGMQTVNALLAGEAVRSPRRIALRHEGSSVDYAALHTRSGRIAACLQALGVKPGQRVGICLDRCIDLVASMLAVMKLGAAYVPLDPAYPSDRLRFMVDDAGLALVVSAGQLADPLMLEPQRVFRLDAERATIEFAEPLPPDTDLATPESVAYVIYTSGSTGKPKGVQVPHRAVVNFLCSMRREPGMAPGDRIVAVTTTSFDIAVLELFLPLSVGAEIVLASRETAIDAFELEALLRDSGATVMQATPSTWRMLLDAGWSPGSPFKALCGGEALAPDLARALCERCGEVWNMYGPTETTVWSTCARIAAGDVDDITIGQPIANTTVHVLDDALEPCPLGQVGEICIGGMGVTHGYLGRPGLTTERFIPDWFEGRERVGGPGTLYRTGDLGRLRGDGKLEHLGRADHQVKLRGHRIELGEIEAALMSHPAVSRAVVVTHEIGPGDVRLVAHVVPAAGAVVQAAALIGHLRRDLPAYMLPQHVVKLDALPLLPNGKIDRNSLPVPGHAAPQPVVPERGEASSAVAVATVALPPVAATATVSDPRIRYLVQVWSELLGMQASPGDNFFDLGGHSMLAVQMANRVARDTGVRLKLMRLASLTLEQVAHELPGMVPAAEGTRNASLGRRVMDAIRRIVGRGEAVQP